MADKLEQAWQLLIASAQLEREPFDQEFPPFAYAQLLPTQMARELVGDKVWLGFYDEGEAVVETSLVPFFLTRAICTAMDAIHRKLHWTPQVEATSERLRVFFGNVRRHERSCRNAAGAYSPYADSKVEAALKVLEEGDF